MLKAIDVSAKFVRVVLTVLLHLLRNGLSAHAFTEAVAQGRTDCGPYANPVLFLQHMVWHEGWHFGLIMLALRDGGQEPPEAWEEENVWGLWRTE